MSSGDGVCPANANAPQSGAHQLFQPGDGAPPPALTGRGAEQDVLARCLGVLRSGAAPPHNVVLVGPRGNGKTVLLNWFETACRRGPERVDTVWLTPRDVPDPKALVEMLAPRRGIAKLLPRKVGVASVGSAEWASSGETRRNLVRDLTARCRRRPVVALLDEAHTLDATVGGVLLNASQQVRLKAPFLLVLAGTPGLAARLDAMDASFWSRLGDGLLGIGRLSEAAAAEALAKPLQANDVCVDAQALELAVRHSQRYPYFLQLWGDALWRRRLTTGATRLTLADANAVADEVAVRTTEYYDSRFAELEARCLVSAAKTVAAVFQDDFDRSASNGEINAALTAAGIEDERERFHTREALHRLGYIWRAPGQLPPVTWTAGIPSLMAHVLTHANGAAGAA